MNESASKAEVKSCVNCIDYSNKNSYCYEFAEPKAGNCWRPSQFYLINKRLNELESQLCKARSRMDGLEELLKSLQQEVWAIKHPGPEPKDSKREEYECYKKLESDLCMCSKCMSKSESVAKDNLICQ